MKMARKSAIWQVFGEGPLNGLWDRALAGLITLLLAGIVSHAQAPTGGIAGDAVDPRGGVVAGVEVVLRNTQTGESQATKTNPDGYYEFLLLRPATYEITAHEKGFSSLHHGNIAVTVGSVVRVDLHLELGEVSQTVEITAQVPLIEPDRTSIVQTVDLKSVSNLPMLGRQILNLALTVPGTIPSAPGTQVNAFSVAGMRAQSNNYTLDGISINDPQVNGPLNGFRITEAIQEFNVQTSIASPEVGRNSGAQVNIITKSGGNNLHGSLFYTGRNDALDANDFFLNKKGLKKNALRRHQFGGSAGGRILRDKTFWFFSYEGFRETFQQPVNTRVPTLAERALVTDPVSIKVLQFYPLPLPNATGTTNWAGTAARSTNDDTYFWRLDHNLTSNHHLLLRYAWLHGSTDELQSSANPFHGNITNLPSQHNALVQESWASTKLVNEAQLGFSRNRTFFQPKDVALNPASIFTDANGNPLPGFVNTSVDSLDGGLPNINIGGGFGGFGAGTNMPQGRATNTYEAIDNITFLNPFGWSRHTFRFGGALRHEITNRFLNGNYRGRITFDCFSGCVSSFAAGSPLSGALRTGVGGTFRTWSRNVWSWYAQDIYKPRANWTVQYGMRWEYFGQLVEKHDRGSNFVPGIGMMALGSNMRIDVDPNQLGRNAIILTPVNFQLPRSGQTSSDYHDFAPFLGISWQPKILKGLFGDGRTVIRTGFRTSYDDIFANIPVNMGLNLPNVLTTTLPDATSTSRYSWATILNQNTSLWASNNVPLGIQGIVSFNAWDPNARTAYAMNYALELERQLGQDYSLALSYVGSQGRRLGVYSDVNEPFVTVSDPLVLGTQSPNLRSFPFPQYAGISLGTFGANSNYNGMVATFRRRATHGVSYRASYTFGKSLDDNSSFFGSDRDNGSFADPRNRAAERARSDFDVRHRVVADMIYQLPFGPGRRWLGNLHGPLGHVVGGWDFSGIFQYRSGFPFTIWAGNGFRDYSGFNQKADRPNFAPGVTDISLNYDNPDDVFNCHKAACPLFTRPFAGTIGNVGRNRFGGPTFTDLDFGAFKSFPFGEGRRLQFRAELFNAFNKTNFGLPSSNIQFNSLTTAASSTVGTVTSLSPNLPRIIQLTLRVDF